MSQPIWTSVEGPGPVVAFAVHAGHELRPEIQDKMVLGDADRLREEDPFTDMLTTVAANRIVACRSRFEVDLNRPRETAVYRTEQDCWGLKVWGEELPQDVVARSLDVYDRFHAHAREILDRVIRRHGRALVLDLHSYNHRRGGAGADAEDPAANPEVNLGTANLDRGRWGNLVDRFVSELSSRHLADGPADVRENVKFRGGHLGRWIGEEFPATACTLSIEFKKTFMDEWTGEPDLSRIGSIRSALGGVLPGLIQELFR